MLVDKLNGLLVYHALQLPSLNDTLAQLILGFLEHSFQLLSFAPAFLSLLLHLLQHQTNLLKLPLQVPVLLLHFEALLLLLPQSPLSLSQSVLQQGLVLGVRMVGAQGVQLVVQLVVVLSELHDHLFPLVHRVH